MIVVADSGPIHYLVLLDQSELLVHLYGRVVIPDRVAEELDAASTPAPVREWIARPPAWVQIIPVTPETTRGISEELDPGERAAIAIAAALGADLLLMDDAAGREEARRRNLRVTGTLGVLRAGAEQGRVDVKPMLERSRTTNFYVDDALLNSIFAPWLSPGDQRP